MIRTILAGAATLALAGCLLPEAQDQPAADAAYDEQLRAIVVGWFDECGANDYDAEGNRLANDCVERRLVELKRAYYIGMAERDDRTVYVERDTPIRVPMIYPASPRSIQA